MRHGLPAGWRPGIDVRRYLTLLAVILALAGLWGYCGRAPAIRNPRPASPLIVCFGDSLTYGTGAERSESYPVRLADLTGHTVINAGVPGDTTGAALGRLERDVLSRRPGYVLLTLGGNDLRQRVPTSQIEANLRRIVKRCQAAGALVVIGGIRVPFWGSDLKDAYGRVAREEGALLIEDVYAGIWGHSTLMSDEVHPNAAGYRIMAESFGKAIKPYL